MNRTLNQQGMGIYAELAAEAPVGAHPSFEESAAYVDGLLDGEARRHLQDHVSSCAGCAELVADLRAFRNEIAPDLDRELRPAGAQPAVPAVKSPAQRFRLPVWAWATAVALLAVAGWIVWRSASSSGPSPVAIATPTPAASEPPAPPAAVVARLNDGGAVVELDARGGLAGTEQWPANYQEMAKEALTQQRIARSPLLADLGRPASALMGEPGEDSGFALQSPVGRVVLSDRPALRWSALEGATNYVVEIYDSQFNLAASSPLLTERAWTPPTLARGRIYAWQVRATRDGQELIAPRPPAPQARFRVLDSTSAQEIARLQRAFPASHLLLGLAYAQAGLVAEAERELRALQQENPDPPAAEIAEKLLASLSAPRRR
ncbi:MAG: zf-HC2 domain-containing protein [Blastocatellia bacterium]|nr:zf-HC2 domain-containing protein [Blastocatellia bacterium]